MNSGSRSGCELCIARDIRFKDCGLAMSFRTCSGAGIAAMTVTLTSPIFHINPYRFPTLSVTSRTACRKSCRNSCLGSHQRR